MSSRQRPNILFIIADQLRPQSCGYVGDARARTPVLDRLAGQGCSLSNATSVHPVCGPYRASLFTGCYSSTTGYVINELACRTDLPTLAGCLNQAGYRSAYFGKWHLWASQAKDDPGAFHKNEANQYVPPGPPRLGFDDRWCAYNFNHNYYNGFYYRDTMERIRLAGYEPDAMTDLLLGYLADDRSEPFFACISFGTPHQPWDTWNVPDRWLAQFADLEFELPENYAPGSGEYWHSWFDTAWWEKKIAPNLTAWMRRYYAMTANLDWNVGRLLDALDRSGRAKETVVVVTSDHGEMFGAHGRVQKNIFYEEAARVPLLIRWPGSIPAGLVADACINTPDLMPTLLGIAGVPVPETVEGMDLSHCARGEKGPEPEAALLQGMGPSVDWDDGFEWRALRDKRHTYAVHRVDGHEELYNNGNDPLQMRNLVAVPAAAPALDHMRRRLGDRMSELDDTLEPVTWYRDRWIEGGQVLRGAR